MKIPAGWVAIYNRVDYAISDVQIGWKTLEGFVNMVEARAILGQRELEYHEYINERSNVDLVKAFDNLNKENIELRAKLRKTLKSYYDTKEENVKLAKNQLAEPQRMVIDRAAKLVNLAEKSSLQHFPYAEYHSLRAALACIAPGGL